MARQKHGPRSRKSRLNRVNNDVNYRRKSDCRARDAIAPRRSAPARHVATRRGATLSMQRAVK